MSVQNPIWRSTRAIGGSLVAVAALLLGSCRERAALPAPAAPPLRVAIDLWPGYYPLVIAEARGFFAEENVRVELALPQDTHRMIADFAARKHDIICVSLGDIILTARMQPDIRLILNADESAGGDQLLGRGPLTSPDALRGKKIGTTMGGFGELFLRRFLEKQGVSPDSVTLVNSDAAQVPALLARGELDAGHTWEPYAGRAREQGAQVWFTSAETPGLILDGVIIHPAALRTREAETRRFVRSWFRAVDWWTAHEAEGNALCEQRLKLPAGSVTRRGLRLLTRDDNRRAFTPGHTGSLHDAMHAYVEFFISRGALSRRIPANDLLDGRFIE